MGIFSEFNESLIKGLLRDYISGEVLIQKSWAYKLSKYIPKQKILESFNIAFGEWCKITNMPDIISMVNKNEHDLLGCDFEYSIDINSDDKTFSMYFPYGQILFEQEGYVLVVIRVNMFSDYPIQKGWSSEMKFLKKGSIIDLSQSASTNRNRLENSLNEFEKLIDAEIVDFGSGNTEAKEKIFKYGFKPMTERKELYEKQQKGGFLSRFFR